MGLVPAQGPGVALAERLPPTRGGADLAWAPAGLLALVFLATGAGKLWDLAGFAGILGGYRLVPVPLRWPAALLLALAELGLALGLLLPAWRRRAALAAVGLVLGCGAAMALALLRGQYLANSGRFGVFLPQPLDGLTLMQDAALFGLALFVVLAGRGPRGAAEPPG